MKHVWWIALVTGATAASACSPAPLPIASSPDDPSNPRAEAGVAPPVAPTTMTPPAEAGAPSGHQNHGH